MRARTKNYNITGSEWDLLFGNVCYEVDDAVGVADFVVVPAYDFDHFVDYGCELAVEKAGMWVADDVYGYDWVCGVVEDSTKIGFCGMFEGVVDLGDGNGFLDVECNVCKGAVGHGDAYAATAEFACKVWENFG